MYFMIDTLFGEYLIKFNDVVIENNIKNPKVALTIVATKRSFWLSYVVKNIIYKTDNMYQVYFFGTYSSIEYMKSIFDNKIIYKLINEIHNIKDYNRLLLNNSFWNHFSEEYTLIFQPDTIILRNFKESDFNYPYIGAICGNIKNFVMCGGLSLRKTSIMIDICNNLTNKEKNGNVNEDIIFTEKIKKNYMCPSLEECNNFAIESNGTLEKAFGIHGTDKYYICPLIRNKFKLI